MVGRNLALRSSENLSCASGTTQNRDCSLEEPGIGQTSLDGNDLVLDPLWAQSSSWECPKETLPKRRSLGKNTVVDSEFAAAGHGQLTTLLTEALTQREV